METLKGAVTTERAGPKMQIVNTSALQH
uniref:Uncharacterized protein n=1 Tax=Anguilla anguilla TaxID=7936 RepID=A0A0E9R2U3_ANGAN